MSKQQSTNDFSERHKSLTDKTHFSDFLVQFSERLITEPDDVSRMFEKMNNAIMSGRVKKWAQRTDLIGAATGFSSSLSDKQKAHEVSLIVDEMSSDTMDDFGGLRRSFSAVRNDTYLDAVKAEDDDVKSDKDELAARTTEQMSREESARQLVQESFNQLEQLQNENFPLAA